MTELERVMMRRDDLTLEEVREMIEEAKMLIADGDDPEDVLREEFGLEPDYIFDLLQ